MNTYDAMKRGQEQALEIAIATLKERAFHADNGYARDALQAAADHFQRILDIRLEKG